MQTFWETIAQYNAVTGAVQLLLVAVGAVWVGMVWKSGSKGASIGLKSYMVLVNLWIAGVYYMGFCREREFHGQMALFWVLMGGLWLFDLLLTRTPLEYRHRHRGFGLLLLLMPVLYPVLSLLLGREFPMMTMPIMPCSVVMFSAAVMYLFYPSLPVVGAMCLCHWTLFGLFKVYNFGIPEDYLMALGLIPMLYIFFEEYVLRRSVSPCKPSNGLLRGLVLSICILVTGFLLTVFVLQIHSYLYSSPMR